MSHSGGAGFSQASARRVQSRGWSTYNSFDINLWSTGWIYERPFGKGKRFGAGWNPVADKLIGGWQIGGILFFRSGLPLRYRSRPACCPPAPAIGQTGFRERFEHQLKLELFNALNHPQFSGTGSSIGTATAGVISSLLFNTPMRQIQVAMKLSF